MEKARNTTCDVTLNVLGYQEEGEWIALALEMDLRGYGKNFKAALENLAESIAMQISFAEFKNQPEMVWHPAAATYYQLYAQVREDRLRSLARSSMAADAEYQVAGVSIPPAHVIAEHKKRFSLVNG